MSITIRSILLLSASILIFTSCTAKLPLLSYGASEKIESISGSVADFFGVEKMGYAPMSEENEQFIRSIIEEMGIKRKVIIRRASNQRLRQGFLKNACCLDLGLVVFLFFDEDYFVNILSEPEKDFLVRHEISHALRLHSPIKIASALAIPKIIGLLDNKFFDGHLSKEAKIDAEIGLFPTPAKISQLKTSLSLFCFVALQMYISRLCEFDADINATRSITSNDGGVDLCHHFISERDEPSRFKLIRIMDKLFSILAYPFIATHPPHEERISAIKIADRHKNASLLEILLRHYYGMARQGMRSVQASFSRMLRAG